MLAGGPLNSRRVNDKERARSQIRQRAAGEPREILHASLWRGVDPGGDVLCVPGRSAFSRNRLRTALGLLAVDGVVIHCGQALALEHVWLGVEPGELVGVLGRSGAGKTTLLQALFPALRKGGPQQARTLSGGQHQMLAIGAR